MTTIVYLYDRKFSEWRKRLAGIYHVARELLWNVRVVEVSEIGETVSDLMRFWGAVGAIIEGGIADTLGVKACAEARIPIVWCDVDTSKVGRRCLAVQHDSREVARLAIMELLSKKCRCYGFVGFHDRIHWSALRQRVFVEEMRRTGNAYSIFDPTRGQRSLAATEFYKALEKWLIGLGQPCGVFAVNDEMGDHVLRAARTVGIAVPDELVVIGVDDDQLLCESTIPTLASIAPDFERSGSLAAELLDRRLKGMTRLREVVAFGSSGIVPRESIRKFRYSDFAALKAVEFIRRHACEGVKVDDVAREMCASRRSADIRFKRFTGHTIQTELEHVRFRRACELLMRPGVRLDSVYASVGYSHERSLRHLFYKECGMSPRDWREQQCAAR